MAIANVNLTAQHIEAGEKNIPNLVGIIERHIDQASSTIYRIHFTHLEPKGFLVSDDGKQAKFVHYCEQNEKGKSCSHIMVAAAIADKVGLRVTKTSTKSGPEVVDTFNNLNEASFEDVSHEFGLVTAPAPASSSTPVSKPSPAVAAAPTANRNWQQGWPDVQDYLQEQGVMPTLTKRVRDRRIQVFNTVHYSPAAAAPSKPATPYQGAMLNRALKHVMNGRDLILIGGKGTGKDTLIATIGWILGLPITLQSGNADETKESLVGEQGFKNGESTFIKSPYAQAVENGWLCNYAELNFLHADVTAIFHSVLDDNKALSTPEGTIKRHPQHLFIGSMNVGEGYHGVKDLNDALKDRFTILRLPYTQDFRSLLESKTGLKDDIALDFLEHVKKAIDEMISTEGQGHAAQTIRGYISGAQHIKEYGLTAETRQEVIEDFVLNKLENLDEYMAARQFIRDKVWDKYPESDEELAYANGVTV